MLHAIWLAVEIYIILYNLCYLYRDKLDVLNVSIQSTLYMYLDLNIHSRL